CSTGWASSSLMTYAPWPKLWLVGHSKRYWRPVLVSVSTRMVNAMRVVVWATVVARSRAANSRGCETVTYGTMDRTARTHTLDGVTATRLHRGTFWASSPARPRDIPSMAPDG